MKKFLFSIVTVFCLVFITVSSTDLFAKGAKYEWCDEDFECCNDGHCCLSFSAF